jgi:uncharacterized protein (DUF58 family)
VTDPPPGSLITSGDLRALEHLTVDSFEALLGGVGSRRGGPGRTGGFEFADYRRYAQGDDVRWIDWAVYARLRELHVRTPPQEARLALALLLDASASMDSGEPTKLRYGQRLAALLGALALMRADTVQVHTLYDGDAVTGGLYDASGMLWPLIHELQTLPSGRTTDLASSVRRARDQGADAEMAVLISDALTPRERLREALREFARDVRAPVLAHIVDSTDATAGPTGPIALVDRETGQRIELDVTEDTRARYAEHYARLRDEIEDACRAAGVRYLEVPTAVDALDLLLDSARTASLLMPRSG